MTARFPAYLLLFWALPLLLHAAAPRDPYQYFFEQTLGDLTEELEIARDEGKSAVFVFFEMDECPFCHRMKQTVLNRPEVQEYFRERFHSISVDIEGDIEIIDFEGNATTQKEFARSNRVRATPLMAFYDLDGNRIFKYVGATSGAEEFMWMGEYIGDGVYLQKDESGRNIRFARYKKTKKEQSL